MSENHAVVPTAPSGQIYPSRMLTFLAYADLETAVSCAPDPVTAGNQLTYTSTVTNNGPNNASSVSLTDSLPNEVAFVEVTPATVRIRKVVLDQTERGRSASRAKKNA